ncbi:Putative disease resistance protein RGA4 [Linum grandiflorum]
MYRVGGSNQYRLSSNDTKCYDMQYLTSVKSVEIGYCPNLIGWATTKADLPLLPRVSKIHIWCRPKLKIVPRFVIHFEDVQLVSVRIELLSQLGESFFPPTPPAHPRFHSLTLSGIDHPMILQPQVGFLQRLTSLERLLLLGCKHITTLSLDILRHLPSLQQLKIESCRALEFEDYEYGNNDNTSLPLLPNLRRFSVWEIPKLVTLPKWLQHSSKLQQLEIYLCHSLKCLPSWLANLNALESLEVCGCDLLSGRCGCNTAEDWPNIAHIPNIRSEGIMIQRGGIYLGVQQHEEQLQLQDQEQQDTEEEASSHTQFSSLYLVLLEERENLGKEISSKDIEELKYYKERKADREWRMEVFGKLEQASTLRFATKTDDGNPEMN